MGTGLRLGGGHGLHPVDADHAQRTVRTQPGAAQASLPNTFKFICTASVLGHVAISYCLPVKVRRDWQVVTVFLETTAVTDNYFRAGLSIKF